MLKNQKNDLRLKFSTMSEKPVEILCEERIQELNQMILNTKMLIEKVMNMRSKFLFD